MNEGRYIVVDFATKRKFWVEPISQRNERIDGHAFTNGGISGDEVKNKQTGGSVKEEDSYITFENGFTHITTFGAGVSPNGYIEELCRTGKRVGE
jgi:hypothetical protein